MKLNIVMVEPEIPQNTGNIARTCAAIGAKLHLVKPLGFEISDKYLKRAGLDYWDKLDIEIHENLEEFLKKYPPEENAMYFSTTKGKQCYSDMNYTKSKEIFIFEYVIPVICSISRGKRSVGTIGRRHRFDNAIPKLIRR